MKRMLHEVPFYTQHWDKDAWEELGFSNREDSEYWERSSCAILCLAMALHHFHHTPVNVHELIMKGVEKGFYSDAEGWRHAGIVELARSEGLLATQNVLTPEQIGEKVKEGALVMISIKWAFQNNKSLKERILFWKKYGGHLALVVGAVYEREKLTHLVVHHTSKIKEQNWQARPVDLLTFKRGFTGRAIILNDSLP